MYRECFLCRYGQKMWMLDNHGIVEDFIAVFGKNYLTEDETNGKVQNTKDM